MNETQKRRINDRNCHEQRLYCDWKLSNEEDMQSAIEGVITETGTPFICRLHRGRLTPHQVKTICRAKKACDCCQWRSKNYLLVSIYVSVTRVSAKLLHVPEQAVLARDVGFPNLREQAIGPPELTNDKSEVNQDQKKNQKKTNCSWESMRTWTMTTNDSNKTDVAYFILPTRISSLKNALWDFSPLSVDVRRLSETS